MKLWETRELGAGPGASFAFISPAEEIALLYIETRARDIKYNSNHIQPLHAHTYSQAILLLFGIIRSP